MRIFCCAAVLFAIAGLVLGCADGRSGVSTETAAPQGDRDVNAAQDVSSASSERIAALAKLSDADRASAEAQGYCVVTGEPLGSMGPPLKMMVNERPVWVCCKGCEKKAQSNPEQTLARVADLQEKVKAERVSGQPR